MLMGFSFGIKVIGMMTLSSSLSLSIVLAMGGSLIIWENPVGVQSCVDGDLEGAPGSVAGGVGVGCCNGGAVVGAVGCTEFKHGDHLVGAGMEARPGVLLRVTQLCVCLAVLSVLGVVQLLRGVGSTLGVLPPAPPPSEVTDC